MNDATLAALNAMDGEDSISREGVRAWMRDADLDTRGVVYRLTDAAWDRITPPLEALEQCDFMAKYLLECIEVDPEPDDYQFSGFDAAWEFCSWLKHIHKTASAGVLHRAVMGLEALARRGDWELTCRVGAGTLHGSPFASSVYPQSVQLARASIQPFSVETSSSGENRYGTGINGEALGSWSRDSCRADASG